MALAPQRQPASTDQNRQLPNVATGSESDVGRSAFRERAKARLENEGADQERGRRQDDDRHPPRREPPADSDDLQIPDGLFNDEPPLDEDDRTTGRDDDDYIDDEYDDDLDDGVEDPEEPDGDYEDDDDLDLTDREREFQARAEKAENRVQEMTSDYTRKTQRVAQVMQTLEPLMQDNLAVTASYLQNAETYLARFQNMDWNELQRTLSPQDFRQREAQYKQAVGIYQQAEQQHTQYVEAAKQSRMVAKKKQAELAGEMLRTMVSDWGQDMYAEVRQFAVETAGYTPEEFADITDHKHLYGLWFQWQASNPGEVVRGKKRKPGKPRPSRRRNRNKATNQRVRDKQLDDHRRANPGDRDANREHFRRKLERERGVSRNRR